MESKKTGDSQSTPRAKRVAKPSWWTGDFEISNRAVQNCTDSELRAAIRDLKKERWVSYYFYLATVLRGRKQAKRRRVSLEMARDQYQLPMVGYEANFADPVFASGLDHPARQRSPQTA